MTILLFLLVLVALIVVHELGHFFVAKWSGMRVDEFGLGYPPRALTVARHNGTAYTLNWIPFGGFVKIHGEDGETPAAPDSFAGKPRWQQALVLIAGIAMNLLFAWVLLSVTLALGMPRALTDAEAATVPGAVLVIGSVSPESPAGHAGLAAGDEIVRASSAVSSYESASAEAFTTFVAATGAHPLTLTYTRNGATHEVLMTPEIGIVPSDPSRAALGVGVGAVGTAPVPPLLAPVEGAKLTASATAAIAEGLVSFFAGIATLHANLAEVSGPIGIAGAVGAASASGLTALLSLVAIISINLALVNLIPFPALDGGRLLFVAIEAVTRKPIPDRVAGTLNTVGFVFLILLMALVTASDVFKLFA